MYLISLEKNLQVLCRILTTPMSSASACNDEEIVIFIFREQTAQPIRFEVQPKLTEYTASDEGSADIEHYRLSPFSGFRTS